MADVDGTKELYGEILDCMSDARAKKGKRNERWRRVYFDVYPVTYDAGSGWYPEVMARTWPKVLLFLVFSPGFVVDEEDVTGMCCLRMFGLLPSQNDTMDLEKKGIAERPNWVPIYL